MLSLLYRYKSPLRPRKESTENINNRNTRERRNVTPEIKTQDLRDRRKPNKDWEKEREGRQWDKRREKKEKVENGNKRVRDNNRVEKQKLEEPKEETTSLKVTNNPVFEARRKKFESITVVEPASKKIRLANKRSSPVLEKAVVKEIKEEKKVIEVADEKNMSNHSDEKQVESFSGREEIDEIDSFLNEDVLDLSAEVWSSDDELFPKPKKNKPIAVSKAKSPIQTKPAPVQTKPVVKEKIEFNKKGKLNVLIFIYLH